MKLYYFESRTRTPWWYYLDFKISFKKDFFIYGNQYDGIMILNSQNEIVYEIRKGF
jgi:hypothetical protein